MQATRRNFVKAAALSAAAVSCNDIFAKTAPLRADSIESSKPNIVFIMADQFRKQAIGFMRQDSVHTPNLDKLAADGAAFTSAISTVPVCTPNRSCLFTGKYSLHNRMLCNDIVLMPEQRTLGDFCKSAGYQTAYFGKWHLGFHKTGNSQFTYVPPELRHGFDRWFVSQSHTPFNEPFFIDDQKNAVAIPGWSPDIVASKSIEYLEQREAAKPFCMVVSFGPPHTGGGPGTEGHFMPGHRSAYEAALSQGKAPPPPSWGYTAPPQYEKFYEKGGECYRRPVRSNVSIDIPYLEESQCIPGYFGAVTAIDKAVGDILQALDRKGIADNTIVAFTADHGEMMGSHGLFAKDQFYQESSGIPLILRCPGKIRRASHNNVFNSIDVLPTLLGLAEVHAGGMDGTDFAPLLRGRRMSLPEYAFGAYFQGGFFEGPRHFRAVYTTRYTYALTQGVYAKQFGPEVLFDRQVDPYEMTMIVRGQGRDREMDTLKKVLATHLQSLGDPFLEEVWAGGPNAQHPENSFYSQIIADSRFVDQPGGTHPVE